MSLPDQYTGVVDGLRETALEDLGLETTLQEILDLKRQHVIETHARLIEHTDTDETANKSVTLEETLGVLGVELQELTSGTTNLGKCETNAPDLTLVAETVFTSKLERTHVYQLIMPPKTTEPNTPSARHRDERIRKVDEGPCSCNIIGSTIMGHGLISTMHPSTMWILKKGKLLTSCCGSAVPCVCKVSTQTFNKQHDGIT